MSEEVTTLELHKVIEIIEKMCELQVRGIDTAIPFLRGAPGGGKTESIRNMAKSKGHEFMSVHFALKQPEDLGGIPQFGKFTMKDGKEVLSTTWSIPEILENLIRLSEKAAENKKMVILFLDDIHRCGPFHVTALFELLSERKIREIHIPDNVAIVLAGNGSIKAGAQLTNSAIINRCSVFDVETDFDYWREEYALKNNFNLHILAFLQNQRYRKWFHAEEDINNPWGSPRSWSKLSNILNLYLDGKTRVSADKIEYICKSHVGENAAKEFISFYQIVSKFNIDELFKKVKKDLEEQTLKKAIDNIIEEIKKYDELEQFALAQAILIGYTQSDKKSRKNSRINDIMAACLLGIELNPENMLPEMVLSMIKEIQLIMSDKECNLISDTFDEMAKAIGAKNINELARDFYKRTTDL